MSNLVLNGDFSLLDKHWTDENANYYDGKAHVSTFGHIKQAITLGEPLKKGNAVRIKFKVSGMYGSQVTVSAAGVSYPPITKDGEHDIALILNDDMATNILTLRFQASNAFTLDDVWLELENKACTPKNVIQNGEFSNPGEPGKHWEKYGNTTFSDGKANVAGGGYVKQLVTLDRPLVKGDIVKINFGISNLYGVVTVFFPEASYEPFDTIGEKNIALTMNSDHTSNEVTLKFQASSAFSLDNVEMIVCL